MKNIQGKNASDQAWGVIGSAPLSLVSFFGVSNKKGAKNGKKKKENKGSE